MERAWNVESSEVAKEEGMKQAARNRLLILRYARQVALRIAKSRLDRTCTADDVQFALVREGFSCSSLGNAAGSLFRQKFWVFTGERIRSKRVASHSREVKVWRYVGA